MEFSQEEFEYLVKDNPNLISRITNLLNTVPTNSEIKNKVIHQFIQLEQATNTVYTNPRALSKIYQLYTSFVASQQMWLDNYIGNRNIIYQKYIESNFTFELSIFESLIDIQLMNPELKLSGDDNKYLLDNLEVLESCKTIIDDNNGDDFSLTSVEVYAQLARNHLLELTYSELESLEVLLDGIISTSLNEHNLGDRTVISASTWYMVFQTEALDNGNDPISWLKAQIKSIKEGFLEVFQPLVEAHAEYYETIAEELGLPENPEEWRALMAVYGPMLLELGVDIGTDFIPIVGEIKAFTKSGIAFSEERYGDALFEFIGGVAGIIPVGDLISGAGKVIQVTGAVFLSFKAIKALAKVSGNIYSKLIEYANLGWKIAWEDGLKKMIFKSGDEVVGSISSKSDEIFDASDPSFPDGSYEVPSIKVDKAEGWALKQGDDIAASSGTVPTGQNSTYIGKKNIANNGHRIKADHPPSIKNKVDEIVANGDQSGVLTEELSSEVLENIYPNGTVYGPPLIIFTTQETKDLIIS